MNGVALIGMPGSGKTTLGKQLARRLRVQFSDSDHVIEQRIGCSISEFFRTEGEARFREVEQAIVDALSADPGCGVLATGGGSVLSALTRKRLRERLCVVYLHSHPEELHRRLRFDTARPLLQGVDSLMRLRELYSERDPLYRSVAHFSVEIGRSGLPTVLNLMQMQLDLHHLSRHGDLDDALE